MIINLFCWVFLLDEMKTSKTSYIELVPTTNFGDFLSVSLTMKLLFWHEIRLISDHGKFIWGDSLGRVEYR